jgi:CHASE2 domain-containing sensor protein
VAKGWGYWIGAALVLIVATTGSHFVYEELRLEGLREALFQTWAEWAPRPTEPRYTRLVLIGDDEYWKGELAGRRPIKRRYLAELITDLAQANAHVIALDFDVRLPNPSSMTIPLDYADETKVLIDAIKKAAASGVKIVLATPISRKTRESSEYYRDSDIYQASGLCIHKQANDAPAKADRSNAADAIEKNITCGYIALPFDPLAIPGPLPVVGEGHLDSFALAIARAVDGNLVKRMEVAGRIGHTNRYGNFMSDAKLRNSGTTISARELREHPRRQGNLAAKAVIIGADWSRDAAGRGPRVDQHRTPVGYITGAVMHANFVEAILDDRTFAATPEWVLTVIEVLFGIIAGGVFAVVFSSAAKLFWMAALVGITFVAQWLLLHELGVFFDALVPVVGLGVHSLSENKLESLKEWWEKNSPARGRRETSD